MRTEQEMFDVILRFAEKDKRVRAVYMNGSRANPIIKKDKYQDYDIVFAVTETAPFIKNQDWIKDFGDAALVFEGDKNKIRFGLRDESIDFSRRYVWCMLFKDGNRVDLVMETVAEAVKNFTANKLTVLLLDKDNFLPDIPPPTDEDYHVKKPGENAYTACCHGFWWFLNDVAKGIARDQLPYAMDVLNAFVRLTLNQMVDWYIGIQTGFSVSTGKKGKHYIKYLPAEYYQLYAKTYSDSGYNNFWNAVFSCCDLFTIIAARVGGYFNFSYDIQEENNMRAYLIKVKNDTL